MRYIIFLLSFSTLLISLHATSHNDNYYTGFIETLGLDTHVTDDGVDCTVPASKAVYHFRDAILNGHRDMETYLHAVVDVIDKLKYEISPFCRTYYGDFYNFMSNYFGDATELNTLAEGNFRRYHQNINQIIEESLEVLEAGDDYEAGRAHAYLLRLFVDLEKSGVSLITFAQTVQDAVVNGGEKLFEAMREKIAEMKEIIVKVEPSDEEEFNDNVQVYVQELNRDNGDADDYNIDYTGEKEPEQERYDKQHYVQSDYQGSSDTFDQQVDYDLYDGEGSEAEYGNFEAEGVLVTDIGDGETIGLFIDMDYYNEDDHDMETKGEIMVNVYYEVSEKHEDDGESFRAQDNSDEVKSEDEIEDCGEEDDTEESDNYSADYSDYHVRVIQRRMLSQVYYEYGQDYDL